MTGPALATHQPQWPTTQPSSPSHGGMLSPVGQHTRHPSLTSSYGTQEAHTPPCTPPEHAAVPGAPPPPHLIPPMWDMPLLSAPALPQGAGSPAMRVGHALGGARVSQYDPSFAFASQPVWVPQAAAALCTPPAAAPQLLNGVPIAPPQALPQPQALYVTPGAGWVPQAGGTAPVPVRQLRRRPRDYYANAPDAGACTIMPIEQQNDKEFESMRAIVAGVVALLRLSSPAAAASAPAPTAAGGCDGDAAATADDSDADADADGDEAGLVCKAQTAAPHQADEDGGADGFLSGGRNWSV